MNISKCKLICILKANTTEIKMSRYHKRLKNEIRQIQLDTLAIRRIRKEMEKELEGELKI